jgi:thymidylate synthase (FAD)
MEKMLMNVTLVSYTQLDKDFAARGFAGNLEELIAFCARVSNPENQANTQTSSRLIDYLIQNKHWSPLEMVSATLEIETTRDIGRQILRHRSFSFQEFSQRYAVASQLGFEGREARLQDTANRQNSVPLNPLFPEDCELMREWEGQQTTVLIAAKNAYQWALNNNIAKEQARCVLPEGMTMSRMYMAGTLRSWWHYIELRSANGTQKEHREIAIACAKEISKVFPLIERAVDK